MNFTVRNALGHCGTITKIKWLTDRVSGDFKGSGFLTFSEPSGAAAALEASGVDCLGKEMIVGPAQVRYKAAHCFVYTCRRLIDLALITGPAEGSARRAAASRWWWRGGVAGELY